MIFKLAIIIIVSILISVNNHHSNPDNPDAPGNKMTLDRQASRVILQFHP